MFSLFIVLSSFSESLDLHFFHMNPIELKYYPFMISLNKCAGSCKVLSPKMCVPKKQTTYKLMNLI